MRCDPETLCEFAVDPPQSHFEAHGDFSSVGAKGGVEYQW